MKAWWVAQGARIDALSLRERVFLFLSVLALCFALADVLWLSPAQVAHRALKQRVLKQTDELVRARAELNAAVAQPDPRRQLREELEQLKQRSAGLNREIASAASAATGAVPLEQVLVHLLRRHEGLSLVQALTLASDGAGGKAASPALLALVRRQGLELTVAGSYGDLIRYVQTLERSLPALRWGSMKLSSEKQPPHLTLQVYVVEVLP